MHVLTQEKKACADKQACAPTSAHARTHASQAHSRACCRCAATWATRKQQACAPKSTFIHAHVHTVVTRSRTCSRCAARWDIRCCAAATSRSSCAPWATLTASSPVHSGCPCAAAALASPAFVSSNLCTRAHVCHNKCTINANRLVCATINAQ